MPASAIVIRQNDGRRMPAEGEAVRLTWRPEDMALCAAERRMSACRRGTRTRRTPWAADRRRRCCCSSASLLIPLAMTVMLSFHDWGQYKGIEPVFILKNWREIATDPYYAEMFLRTFRIAILVTLLTAVLGAPEAYILNRMSGRWQRHFPAGRARAAADLGGGAHARLGAAVRRQQRPRQQALMSARR